MNGPGDAALRYARVAAERAGLELDEAALEAVAANLRILERMAAEFADLPLDPELDPAPVLRL